jgi:hypothetical protein
MTIGTTAFDSPPNLNIKFSTAEKTASALIEVKQQMAGLLADVEARETQYRVADDNFYSCRFYSTGA